VIGSDVKPAKFIAPRRDNQKCYKIICQVRKGTQQKIIIISKGR